MTQAEQPKGEEAGIPLCELLNRVGASIKQGLPAAYWVHAEILKIDKRHYWSLELTGYDGGEQKSKARAMIWGSSSSIVKRFENETRSSLKPGMKILFKCTVQFHAEYGLALTITDIDPRFTLGDMEARLQKIRSRLAELGEIDLNRTLPTPREFCQVAVIAPHMAAGLGDFRSHADELMDHELCQFDYYTAQFQGEKATESMLQAMKEVIERHRSGQTYDALVILRGGGDKAGLYQLNEIKIARGICRCPMPVLVGIGHERDRTVLDELANQYFPTPSLVITHIHSTIVRNARDATQQLLWLKQSTKSHLNRAQNGLISAQNSVSHYAHARLARSKQQTLQFKHAVTHNPSIALQRARQLAAQADARFRDQASRQLSDAQQSLKLTHQAMNHDAASSIQSAKNAVNTCLQHSQKGALSIIHRAKRELIEHKGQLETAVPTLLGNAKYQISVEFSVFQSAARKMAASARADTDQKFLQVVTIAKEQTALARSNTTRLVEQVLFQDPNKVLSRGFSLVKSNQGQPITRAKSLEVGQSIYVQFQDGQVQASIKEVLNE